MGYECWHYDQSDEDSQKGNHRVAQRVWRKEQKGHSDTKENPKENQNITNYSNRSKARDSIDKRLQKQILTDKTVKASEGSFISSDHAQANPTSTKQIILDAQAADAD